MSGRRLSAVTIVVDDYDRAIRHYVDVLGFDLVEDTHLDNGKRWVRVTPGAGAQTSLLLARADGAEQERVIGRQAGGRVGLFIQTDDFDRDFAAMTARGVDFREKPRVEPYGTVAVFADVYGNLFDLIQPAP